jgi:hypothetical protein
MFMLGKPVYIVDAIFCPFVKCQYIETTNSKYHCFRLSSDIILGKKSCKLVLMCI